MVKESISKWFGRPVKELQGWVQRGQAIEEIKDTLGYQLITRALDNELAYARRCLEVCEQKDVQELQLAIKAFSFVKSYILTVERSAEASLKVLEGRPEAIAKDAMSFLNSVSPRK